jgi:hypothetical protein
MELFHIILMSADTYHLFFAKEIRPKLKEENPNLLEERWKREMFGCSISLLP